VTKNYELFEGVVGKVKWWEFKKEKNIKAKN
jgi:hypothetical protein